MKARIATGVAILTVCGIIVGSQVLSQATAGDAKAEWTIVIKRLEVMTTKADGSSWDVNDGKPDLFVRVTNNSEKGAKSFSTKTKDDTFSADFNEPTTVKFRKGQQLRIEVLDSDVAVNDEIGVINLNTDKLEHDREVTLEKFGRVISLKIVAKKL